MNRLQEKFNKEIVPVLRKEIGLNNLMAIPKLKKVSINVGISRSVSSPDFTSQVVADLKMISGQKPIITKAKKAISGFKIRQGQEVGVAVTLRGKRMWDFVEKFIHSSIPRIRDFRGIEEKNFDNQGNFNYAIREQVIFPEILHDNVQAVFGLQVNINTSAKDKISGIKLLRELGFPIKKEDVPSDKK